MEVLAIYNNYNAGMITKGEVIKPIYGTFVDVPSIPVDYTEASFFTHADKLLEIGFYDYAQLAEKLEEKVIDLGGSLSDISTDAEKLAASKYMSSRSSKRPDDASIIAFYQTSGGGSLSLQAAIDLHNSSVSAHLTKQRECYAQRATSSVIFGIITEHFSYSDMEDVAARTALLLQFYSQFTILGTVYGSSVSGIIDWIDSTGDFVGNGLADQSYILKTSTIAVVKTKLKNWLVSGS